MSAQNYCPAELNRGISGTILYNILARSSEEYTLQILEPGHPHKPAFPTLPIH